MQAVLYGAAAAILATAAYTDLTRRRIGNELVCGLLVLAAIRLGFFAMPGTALLSLGGSALLAALLLVAFARGWLGGGDVKLLIACSLFVGIADMPAFVLATALAGGALSIAVLCALPFRAKAGALPPTGGALRRGGISLSSVRLPYGVAIAAGGVWAMLASALHP
jgi:prepilin peptidase CpaA